jgi:uncharacterized membrane protein
MLVTARRWIALLGAAAVLAAVLLCPSTVAAKSYDHPLVEQTFRLLPDGGAEVEDVRTYRFDGSFSWADLHLKTGGGQYGQYGVTYEGVWDADSGEELPYETSRDGDEEVITWHFNAADTTRRFRLKYRIDGAVQRYDDAAQFYWKAIEDEHAPIDQLRVTVVPPQPSSQLFKVFVHSQAAPGALAIADDFSQATVTQSGIPATSFVELRTLLDPALFPATALSADEHYAGLLADEQRQAAGTLAEGWMLALRWGFFGLLLVALVVGYLWAYWRYGREPELDYQGIYEREPPRPLPPAVLPAILTQGGVENKQLSRGFVATLLEGGRLGYLTFEERMTDGLLGTGLFKHPVMVLRLTQKGTDYFTGRPVERGRQERSLEPFEKEALEVVFYEAGTGPEVTSEQIAAWAKGMEGGKSRFLRFIEQWGPSLRGWFEEQYFSLDDTRSERAKGWFCGVAVVAALAFGFLAPGFLRWVGPVVSIGLLVLAIKALSRRTPEAALEVRRWDGLRRFMTDFSAMKEAGPQFLVLWEHYLVYAAALGVAEKLLENVQLAATELQQPLYAPGWYHSAGADSGVGFVGGAPVAGMASFASSLDNFANLSSALSTSSSEGGGFSGGGGGGGGGGSSGAG